MTAQHTNALGDEEWLGRAPSPPQLDPVRRYTPGMMPFLSLFLLLLAFFLMLSSLSRLEVTRTQAVLGSLSSTFRSDEQAGLQRKLGSTAGPVIGAEQLEATVSDLMRTAVGVDAYEIFRVGNTLTTTFAVDDLFVPRSATPKETAITLAQLFGDAAATEPSNLRYGVTLVMRGTAGVGSLPVARGEVLGELFIEHGVDRRQVAIALERGNAAQLEVRFSITDASELGDVVRGPS